MTKRLSLLLMGTLFFSIVFPCLVSAQIREGSFSLTPQVGGYRFEEEQGLEHGLTGGVGVGYNITKRFALEGTFNYLRTSPKTSGTTVNGYMLREDAVFHFMPDSKVVPYLAGGFGWQWLELPGMTTNPKTMANYGGGIKAFLTENIALRGDVRHVIPFRTPDLNGFSTLRHNLMYTMGIEFLIGGRKKEAPAPAPAPVVAAPEPAPVKEADTDGDGVVDSKDKCPNTPSGVQVNADGCPLDADGDGVYDYLDKCPNTPSGVKVSANGCPLDADGDGVYDYLDKCPDTPSGVKVNADGCPLDTDGDGVYDYLDKCPDTPRDLKVTSDGCPILMKKEVSKRLDIQFDTNKAVIKPEFNDRLKEVADFMNTYPQTTTVIEGHTDSVGTAKYNKTLSQKRADSVRDYLIKNFNISPDRISTMGYGEDQPVASNDNEEGRSQNRRIEAKFKAQTEYYEKR